MFCMSILLLTSRISLFASARHKCLSSTYILIQKSVEKLDICKNISGLRMAPPRNFQPGRYSSAADCCLGAF